MPTPSDTHHQGRVVAGTEDTELAAADVTLGGAWGTSPSVAVAAGSKDHRGRITVTSGSGTPGANPTVTVTFKRAFASAPFVVVSKGDTGAGTWVVTSRSTTAFTATFVGTPAASTAYVLDYICEE
ncbi:MAG TPA: hypothetical protein VNO79_03255 [Actinomycetota bacterium]|nr:hypothetical protein [Actinomycetota bacterium]